jgi:hypothetical protein
MKIWIEQLIILICEPMSASGKPTYAVFNINLCNLCFDEVTSQKTYKKSQEEFLTLNG